MATRNSTSGPSDVVSADDTHSRGPIDLFYSDEDRHRVVLLEQALVSAGVTVKLHTSPFDPASDPVLGVLSEHIEEWMIAQAQRSSAQLIWLRLDHSDMPVAARQSLALQNWPGRSADLAISELARSLRNRSAGPRVSARKPSSVNSRNAVSATKVATENRSSVPSSTIDGGPRPRVVFAWILGLIVVFAGLLNLVPDPTDKPATDEEASIRDTSSALANQEEAPLGSEHDRQDTSRSKAAGSNVVADDSMDQRARVPSETPVAVVSGTAAPITEYAQPVPAEGLAAKAPDASACLALAATDRELAFELLVELSGWDRLLCRIALGDSGQRVLLADQLSRLCLAPSDAALATWLHALEARHMRATPAPCLLLGSLRRPGEPTLASMLPRDVTDR